jgi:hypothetical protein
MRLIERFGNVSHRAFNAKFSTVGSDDPARLLAAMLKRVQTQISQTRRFGMSIDSENTTFFTQLSDLDFSQLNCPGFAGYGDYRVMITQFSRG